MDNNTLKHCYACGNNALVANRSIDTYQYKGHAYDVLVDYSVCSQCGEETITTEQIHINEARTREVKQRLDRLSSLGNIEQKSLKLMR